MDEHMNLMIVEDDSFILDDLASILDWENEGYNLITATNGKQGLNLYKTYRPMIVITDVRMPFMDGLTMMACIKGQNPYVQILVLSAYNDFGPVQEALRQGAKDYLLKQDISASLLREKVTDMRNLLRSQATLNLHAAKDLLHEILSAPPDGNHALKEKLDDICKLCEFFPDDEVFEPIRKSAIDFIKEHTDSIPAFCLDDCHYERAFFDSLYNYCLSGYGRKNQPQNSSESKLSEVVLRALTYIQDNYTDPMLSAGDVAGIVGISYNRLSVLVKDETGKTMSDHLTDIRIEAAKNMLSSGDIKIYEVAEKVGYSSSQYFSYAFHKKTGVSPRYYQRGE